MPKDKIVDALAENREQLPCMNVHCAEDRTLAASSANLMSGRDTERELAHPIRFRDWKNVRMLAKAPSENARPRSR